MMKLPPIRFFEPSEKFFECMRSFKSDIIVDVGAGCGHVSAGLEERGFKVLAIDLFAREETVYPVLTIDAAQFHFPSGCIVLIARPCHGNFIERVVEKALETAKGIFYIGKESNVDLDLGDLPYKKEIIAERVGKENEVMIRIGDSNARNE